MSKMGGSRVKNDANNGKNRNVENHIENPDKSDTQSVKNDVKLVKFDSQKEHEREKSKKSSLITL